jgi:hypothetical protein
MSSKLFANTALMKPPSENIAEVSSSAARITNGWWTCSA